MQQQHRPPMERLAREPEETELESSHVLRIGFVIAAGVIAAVLSSLPAALRMGEDGSALRALEQWVVLSALATPLGVIAVAVIRRARVGLAILAGDRAPLLATGVLWWSVIELALLAIFGAVLKKTTHHHALAGVTFAAFAIVTGVVVALLAFRTTSLIARGGTKLHRAGLGISAGCAFLVLVAVAARTSRAEGMHTAAAIVDVLALVTFATVASSRIMARFRFLSVMGLPAAIVILVIGLTTLRFDPKVRASLPSTAPVHASVLEALGP